MLKNIIAKLLFKIMRSEAFDRLKSHDESRFFVKENLKNQGKNLNLPERFIIKNPKYISIGNNFYSMYNLRLEAWDSFQNCKYTPDIEIGDNVSINTDCHVGCINKVVIGNNVMIASKVYISDHSHGELTAEDIAIIPNQRKLVSKGAVIIEDNVWLGEGVCVLPGVTIGKNSIIGANAVVTKSIPANSIAAGVPARVIKTILA